MNLLRARSALSRSKGAASTFACASLSSIIRSRAFFSVSSRSLISAPFPACPPPRPSWISVEGRRNLAVAKDDQRLVVIVTHLRVARGREGDDTEFARCQSLRRSKRACCRFADYWRVSLQVSTPAGIE